MFRDIVSNTFYWAFLFFQYSKILFSFNKLECWNARFVFIKSPLCVLNVLSNFATSFLNISECVLHASQYSDLLIIYNQNYQQIQLKTGVFVIVLIFRVFSKAYYTICVYKVLWSHVQKYLQRCGKKRSAKNSILLIWSFSVALVYAITTNFIISNTTLRTIGFQLSNHRDKRNTQYFNNYSKPIKNVFHSKLW